MTLHPDEPAMFTDSADPARQREEAANHVATLNDEHAAGRLRNLRDMPAENMTEREAMQISYPQHPTVCPKR